MASTAGLTAEAAAETRAEAPTTGRRDWWVLGGLALAALVVRLWNIGHASLWIDEIRGTIGPQNGPLLANVRNVLGPLDSPAGYVIEALSLHLPFSVETSVRVPAAVFGAAEVVGLWLVVRRLFGRATEATVAAALLAVAPFAVRYGQEARYYTLFSALHLFGWWAALRVVDGRRRAWTVWVALSIAGVYVHPFAWWALAVQVGVIAVAARRSGAGVPVRRLVASVAAVGLVFLPWVLYEVVYWVGAGHGDQSLGFRPAGAPAPSFDFDLFGRGAGWLLANARPGHGFFGLLLGAMALAAPVLARAARRRIAGLLVAYAGATVAVVFVFARLARTYVAYRRLEFLVPVVLTLVAGALGGASDRLRAVTSRQVATAALVVATGVLVAGEARYTADVYRDQKTDYRQMAAIVDDAPPGTVVVLSPFNETPKAEWDPAIERYFDRLGVDRPVLTFDQLASAPPSGDVLWLTGGPASGGPFESTLLNDNGRLEVVAGDRTVGEGLVIPAAVLSSHYDSPEELQAQARLVAAIPFINAPGENP